VTEPVTDTISRTVLISVHDGTQPTIEQAIAAHAATGMVIVIDAEVIRDVPGQAALCTAVATAIRAFGAVAVVADGDVVLAAGPYRGFRITEMINAEGARHAADLSGVPDHWPVLHLGVTTRAPVMPSVAASATGVILRATWIGWTADVRPARTPSAPGRPGNVLAAIAAAALGVHEAFGAVRARPGSDAGHRDIQLNLWNPGDHHDGPALTHAPAAWWLVGLGHLGQAHAWVLSWLTYADPEKVEIVLQDAGRLVAANHSTGILTPRQPGRIRKTRLALAVLDPLGLDTVVLDRPLETTRRTADSDTHVALLGVDNLPTRRHISSVGWPLAIDTGLGVGPTNFNAILMRRFPASVASHQVPGWSDPIPRPRTPSDAPALADLTRRDPCGSVELAGTAVGAAFVGVTAACLAIAQATRTVLNGDGYDVINLHLESDDLTRAPATEQVEVIPARLAAS
jgi:hypothetical protein